MHMVVTAVQQAIRTEHSPDMQRGGMPREKVGADKTRINARQITLWFDAFISDFEQ